MVIMSVQFFIGGNILCCLVRLILLYNLPVKDCCFSHTILLR